MALTIKRDMRLVRLIDSIDDNPLELTIGRVATGRVSLHLEDRDAGTMTGPLTLNVDELRAGLALLDMSPAYYIED